MKKHVAVLFFIGWFFAMKAEVGPGLNAVTVVGPFKSEASCKAYRSDIVEDLKAVGFGGEIAPCVERRGA